MSDKFCLRWDKFQENTKHTFIELRNYQNFTDVTLACEDTQIEAHKVILAASSIFLRRILKDNKHPHPLIYMCGMKAKDLVSVVDFIYYGEVNMYQEELDDFLSLAQEMELKGMEEAVTIHEEYNLEKQPHVKQNKTDMKEDSLKDSYTFKEITTDQIMTVTKQIANLPDNIAQQLESMMTKIEGIWTCTVCGFITKQNQKGHLRDHVETHLKRVTLLCSICGKTFRFEYSHLLTLRNEHICTCNYYVSLQDNICTPDAFK